MRAGDSSGGSLLGSLAAGASSTGRGRGSGSGGAARRWLLPVPVRWRSQVIMSCAVPDWGRGASRRGFGGADGACARTGKVANNTDNRRNAAALNNTLVLMIISPSAARIPLPLSAIVGANLRLFGGRMVRAKTAVAPLALRSRSETAGPAGASRRRCAWRPSPCGLVSAGCHSDGNKFILRKVPEPGRRCSRLQTG